MRWIARIRKQYKVLFAKIAEKIVNNLKLKNIHEIKEKDCL